MTQPFTASTGSAGATTTTNLFASIDMGTNSCKLLIVQADQWSGKFLTIDRHKHPVSSLSSSSSSSLPSAPYLHALQHFAKILASYDTWPALLTRCVATAALRGAANRLEFVNSVKESTGLVVDVISGEEEARLVYLGVLQFLPVLDRRVLIIDIGGGSTEFVVGIGGKVATAVSLELGHVTLSQKFVTEDDGGYDVAGMREFVKLVIMESGLVQKLKEGGFELVIGCSGTVRAVEKAVFRGYGCGLGKGNEGLVREWKFGKADLNGLVERILSCGVEERKRFFGRRSQFIVAGAVLLEEIFEAVGVEEMEVCEYGLGEGVVADRLGEGFVRFDRNVNSRWPGVVRLATRFCKKKGIKSGAQCACIAKVIFEGLTEWGEVTENQVNLFLDEKDFECLEAACLLHNIGLVTGKKGYHKQSYNIIMNGNYLCGYSTEEIKLIALLTKHHRKKFPKFDHSSLKEIPVELKQKFRALCAIIRISVVLQQSGCLNFKHMEFVLSPQGSKLVLRHARNQCDLRVAEDIENQLREELEHFKENLEFRAFLFHTLQAVSVLYLAVNNNNQYIPCWNKIKFIKSSS
ncbi:hypothetical protein Tsubulata_039134 [Turnera subulata]|uniref:Ppx/GppA phosphatase domain-containing protein n=1 Tax=Turnera subulata TaxID=218843 RepID=A0A9Q0F1I2_9ROSI|nr:hypothetical protein Tsubulata_039134 [Turnera subulata]